MTGRPLPGSTARLSVRRVGRPGRTRLDDADYGALVGRLLKEAGVEPELPGLPAGVEAVTRHAADGRRRHVLINHRTPTLHLPEPGARPAHRGVTHEVPPGGCAVLRKP